MNRVYIAAVRAGAHRVIALCEAAENELEVSGDHRYFVGTKISGALRRASLDLTRSLAEMRKP